ncbi:MAG: T9SS type A sorting domain-containing protein [Bacteroidota bacterium]
MRYFFYFSFLLAIPFKIQAQTSQNVWTGWLYGVEYWEEADSCNVTSICDDGDSLSYDYCDGDRCYHTYTYGSPSLPFFTFDVTSNNELWAGRYIGPFGPGLNHFDGTKWHTYLEGLSPLHRNSLERVIVDRNNVVWLSAHLSWLQSFDGQTWTTHNPTNEPLTSPPSINMIYADYQNNIWVDFQFDGLYMFDGQTWTHINDYPFSSFKIVDMLVLPTGERWVIGFHHGAVYYDGQNWIKNPGNTNGNSLFQIYDIAADSTGIVYLGTSNSLLKYEDTTWTSIDPSNHIVTRSIAVAPDNTLWVDRSYVSSYKDSVWNYYFTQGVQYTHAYDFRFGSDSTVYIINDEGIQYLDTSQDTFLTIDRQLGLHDRDVNQLHVRGNDEIWLAGYDGLIYTNGGNWEYYLDQSDTILGPRAAQDVKEDAYGNLWISTSSGVVKYDGNEWRLFDRYNGLPLNDIRNLAIDSQQKVWFIADSRQVYYIQDTTISLLPQQGSPLWGQFFYGCKMDQEDRLWFNMGENLVCWDQQNWKLITAFDPIGSGMETNLHGFELDPSGNIWTYQQNYLLKYDGQQWTSFDFAPFALPNTVFNIRSIKADLVGDIWINTNYQTLKFNGLTLENIPRQPVQGRGRLMAFDRSNRAYFRSSNSTFMRYGPREVDPVYIIKGQIYLDQNQNGIKDSLESPLKNQLVRLLPDSTLRLSDKDGYFRFIVDSGNYQIDYLPPDYLFQTSSPQTINLTVDSLFPQNSPILIGSYFAWDSADYRISLMGDLDPRCSETQVTHLRVSNVGKAFYPAQLHLALDTSLSFVSAQPTPDSIALPDLFWDIDSMEAGQFSDFVVDLVSPGVNSNVDSMFSYTSITPTSPDFLPVNNTDTLTQLLLCAYDPNDKLSFPLTESPEGYIAPQQCLEYRIRFQNTGNTYAENITLLDTLPAELDLSSFQLLGSSHQMEVSITEQRTLKFFFPGIKLPDSTTNEPESHGFVQFKINPKSSLTRFTQIRNRAAIYFDFNPPIYTDFTLNTIGPPPALSIDKTSALPYFQVVPNPFGERFQIEVQNARGELINYSVYNMLGQRIYQQTSADQHEHQIETPHWESGIYLISVETPEGISYQKVIKR